MCDEQMVRENDEMSAFRLLFYDSTRSYCANVQIAWPFIRQRVDSQQGLYTQSTQRNSIEITRESAYSSERAKLP